jgi:hypothetical protein
LLRKHAIFVIAVLVGLAVFLLLTTREVTARNLLAGWNVAAVMFIVATWRRMLKASVATIRKRSADLDFSDSLLMFLSIGSPCQHRRHRARTASGQGGGAQRRARPRAGGRRHHSDLLGLPAHAVYRALRAPLLWRRR